MINQQGLTQFCSVNDCRSATRSYACDGTRVNVSYDSDGQPVKMSFLDADGNHVLCRRDPSGFWVESYDADRF